MQRAAVLPLAAACAEVSSDQPAPAEAAAHGVASPAAAPGTIARPPSPVGGAQDGVSLTHAIHPSLPHHHFTLLPAEDGAIRAIRVRAVGETRAHELPVSESAVGEHLPLAERVLVEDLDFGGYADLGSVTGRGATGNAWADYWRFDPAARRFVAVGTHSVFQVDSAGRQLRTYHKGGHAGLLFTHEMYRWIDGRLVEVERRVLTRDEAVAEAERT